VILKWFFTRPNHYIVAAFFYPLAVEIMEEEKLNNKFDNTKEALDKVIAELRSLGSNPWLGYFEQMGNCIKKKDVESVVRARDAIPFPNMGGFGEFIEFHPELSKKYFNLNKAIENLKLYYRYEIDRKALKI